MSRTRLSMLTRNALGAAALAGVTVLVGAGSATAAPLTPHTTAILGTASTRVSPAAAQDDVYGCPSGFACFYDGTLGIGKFYTEAPTSNCAQINIGSMGMGDRVSSIDNNSNYTVYAYNWGGSAGWIAEALALPHGKGNLVAPNNNVIDMLEMC